MTNHLQCRLRASHSLFHTPQAILTVRSPPTAPVILHICKYIHSFTHAAKGCSVNNYNEPSHLRSMDRDGIMNVKFLINGQYGPSVKEAHYLSISHVGSFLDNSNLSEIFRRSINTASCNFHLPHALCHMHKNISLWWFLSLKEQMILRDKPGPQKSKNSGLGRSRPKILCNLIAQISYPREIITT